MRPLLFSKSRAFEGRAHGGLRVTILFVFSPLADKQSTRSTVGFTRAASAWKSLRYETP